MSTRDKKGMGVHPPQIYSEAFKRQVVSEYESGLFTKASLKRKYGIAGNSCIPRWLKQYGKLNHPTYLSHGRPMKDKDKQYIKELEAELRRKERQLEQELAKKEAELQAYKQCLVLKNSSLCSILSSLNDVPFVSRSFLCLTRVGSISKSS